MSPSARVIRTRAVVWYYGVALARLHVYMHVVVLGKGANNNNTVFGGKRPPVVGVPNKRHSQCRRDTEKETQTNMLWEQ